jgi:hypothetical protein
MTHPSVPELALGIMQQLTDCLPNPCTARISRMTKRAVGYWHGARCEQRRQTVL